MAGRGYAGYTFTDVNKDDFQGLEQLVPRVVILPAAAFAQLHDVRPATLGQGVPLARDTVVRASLPFRHEKTRSARLVGICDVEWRDAGTRDTRSLT